MAELRNVDPRTLKPNPNNPRTTTVPKEMDLQLVASIVAIGLLQPPVAREIDGELVIRAGDRRTKACIAAGLDLIDVYVLQGNEDIDEMASMSENLVRVSMNPVDTWRAIERLQHERWNEDAIADALALPKRTVFKLKLLGSLHPPMLDFMAKGSMPNENQLRIIANAPVADQAEVWKKHKPKKGHDVAWWDVTRALTKQRIPFSAAKFDDKLAEEYGVVWLEDLFAPAGEDSRYTTNGDGFLGAQQAWMAANLPANGTILTQDDHGTAALPKGAERVHGKPTRQDKVGHYVDHRTGEVATITYRMHLPKKPLKTTAKGSVAGAGDTAENDDTDVVVKLRPDVTQKGLAMIGDFRTDALHQALERDFIKDETLIGLLILALGANNVTFATDRGYWRNERAAIRDRISEGGVLTVDPAVLNAAARAMLTMVFSCRTNMTDSGVSSRIAGEALGASELLPTMATEDFLSCLSRQALERSAAADGVKVEIRVKDTRAAMVKHFQDGTWRYSGAQFVLTADERAKASAREAAWADGAVEEEIDRDGEEGGPGDNSTLDEAEPDPRAIAAE